MDTNFNYMVVDDDPTNNLICSFVIKKFDKNAEINIFSEPTEGLKFIENYAGDPVVLFLDINMPLMSGWEFLKEFMKFKTEIRNKFNIYMLTSAIQNFKNEKETFPFLKHILTKPLKLEYLKNLT